MVANRQRNTLFTIRWQMGDEARTVPYYSPDQCLNDGGLQGLLETGKAVCSIWWQDGRMTRDVSTWQDLKEQIVRNSTTLLRGRL